MGNRFIIDTEILIDKAKAGASNLVANMRATASKIRGIAKDIGRAMEDALDKSYEREGSTGRVGMLAMWNESFRNFGSNVKTLISNSRAARKSIDDMGESAGRAGISFKGGFKNILKYAFGIRSVFVLFNRLRRALVDGFKNLAQFNDGINPTNVALSNLKSSLSQLKNSFATAFAPILSVVEPALTALIGKLSQAMTAIGMLFAKISGKNTFIKAVKVQEDFAKSLGGTTKNAKKATKQLASFYDLNVINQKDDSGASAGATVSPNQMFEEVPIEGTLSVIGEKIRSFIDNMKAVLSTMWDGLGIGSVGEVLSKAFETVRGIASRAVGDMSASWQKFTQSLEERGVKIQKILTTVGRAFQLVGLIVQVSLQFITGVFSGLFDMILNIVGHVIDILDGLIDFVAGVFTGDWERAWEGIKNVFKGIFNVIVDILEGAVNAIIRGINYLSFTVPDWIPKIGGKEVGFNLKEIELPRLATGTVVPRSSREFAAILGDNNRETEVVSPLSTIKQALVEAMREGGFGQNVNVYLEGDAAGVFRIVRQEASRYTEETGQFAF